MIVDTEPWFFEATRSTLEDLGVAMSQEQWLRCQALGRGIQTVVEESTQRPIDFVDMRRERDVLYQQLLRENEVLIDGALDVLSHVALHRKMALVSNSLRRFIDQIHGETTVLDHFDCVIASEDCSRHKPHPEPYLRAMEAMGATPERCVAIEDSRRGLTSALAAGVRCLVVRSEFMTTYDFEGAHAVLDDIQGLPAALAI